jgi:polyisoprenoid-binding protein YceI
VKRGWLVTLTLVSLAATASLAAAEPKTFMIDRAHTEVGFNIRHFFTKVHGRFTDFAGSIVYDPKALAASSVDVTIRDTSIWTGTERRDNHLRTEDFFWVEKYPTITFKSSKVIAGKDDHHFQVAGDLTIRGVTKPVTLDVEFLGMGPVDIGGNSLGVQAGFDATTTINRKDYGIVWNKTVDQGGAMLDDNVELVLNVAAFAAGDPKPAATAPATKK